MKKLAIITTHPIQYNAPFFKLLQERGNIEFMVFYTWSQTENEIKYDPDFGKNISWDLPLLEGYNYSFVKNIASKPSSAHFYGINNPSLINELKSWGAEAILVYGWSFKSHLKVLRHFNNKIPILFRGDSTLLDEQKGFKKILRKIFLKWIYSHINYAMFVGNANKAYFKYFGVKENQLVFMPHAIDNDRFSQSKSNTEKAIEFRQKLGILKDEFVFLFVGKLESKKNPKIIAEAFLKLGHNSHLIFVGKGILETQLKGIYKDERRIHFVDFINQSKMPIVYAASNVFVLPSSGPAETWGLSINEAMAAGKAVIASNVCGASYDLISKNGFVFEKGNELDLLSKLKYFTNENAQELGKASLLIIQNYSFEEQCKALENTISKLTNA